MTVPVYHAMSGTHQFLESDTDDYVGFGYVLGSGGSEFTVFDYFASDSFQTVGVHETILYGTDQAGRLTVTRNGGGGGVIPEPTTWAMLIAGFGMVGAAIRRRRRPEGAAAA